MEVIKGAEDDPKLPTDRLDAALIVNAYHEMTAHEAMLRHTLAALKPGGAFVLMEGIWDNREAQSRDEQIKHHQLAPKVATQEVRTAGFEIVELLDPFLERPRDVPMVTFLPLDAYSSLEIEAIADEALGHKRRNLLDELRSEQMRSIHVSLAESARALETNADRIRTAQRTIDDLTEQIEELGDVRGRLSALTPSDRESAEDFVRLSRQQQMNQREIVKLDSADRDLKALGETLERLRREAQNVFAARLTEDQSANADTLRRYDKLLATSMAPVEKHLSAIQTRIREAQDAMAQARQSVAEIHTSHAGDLARLTALNQAASEQARVRASLEQQVAKLEALEQQRVELHGELEGLFERRKSGSKTLW